MWRQPTHRNTLPHYQSIDYYSKNISIHRFDRILFNYVILGSLTYSNAKTTYHRKGFKLSYSFHSRLRFSYPRVVKNFFFLSIPYHIFLFLMIFPSLSLIFSGFFLSYLRKFFFKKVEQN